MHSTLPIDKTSALWASMGVHNDKHISFSLIYYVTYISKANNFSNRGHKKL